MPLSSHLVSRRTTFAAAPILLLAGCRWGPAEQESESVEEKAPARIPDDEQVDAAIAAIGTVEEYVSAVSAEHVDLADTLADLTSMHTAHLDLLAPERPGGSADTPRVPGRAKAALSAVRRKEQGLQTTLVELAAEVSSGTLARTLAAMAAGVAQHRQLLTAPEKGGSA